MKVYKHPTVQILEEFYGALLYRIDLYPIIRLHLSELAGLMWKGIQTGKQALRIEISNYHPGYLGKPYEELKNYQFTFEDCETSILHEYGFESWKEVGDRRYDQDFERAVNSLLAGDLPALEDQIARDPDLVHKRSSYGHEATLLHYATSNGIEMWRQKVPSNLPEIVKYLLDKGADPEALMKVYGGEYNTLSLLKTSVHPYAAGVVERMLELLN